MWQGIQLHKRSCSSSEFTFWRKTIPMQPEWYIFLRSWLFKKTYESTHWGKICQCSHCDKSLRISLIKHRRLYTGEKPFQCNQCDKAFKQKAILKTIWGDILEKKSYQFNIYMTRRSGTQNILQFISGPDLDKKTY